LPWILKIIKDKIINGPREIKKSSGPGQGQRFHPSDYRDLLTIILLRERGIHRRSAWKSHLWLRGHDYGIEEFRASLLREVRMTRKAVLKDFSSRGVRARVPFQKMYGRYMRRRATHGLDNEDAAAFEMFAAMQIAPHSVSELTPDIKAIARTIRSAAGADIKDLEPALAELFDAWKMKRDPSAEAQQTLSSLVQNSKIAPIVNIVAKNGAAAEEFGKDFLLRMRGTLNDSTISAKESSALITTVKRASVEDFEEARRWYVGFRSGRIERNLRKVRPQAPEDGRSVIDMLIDVAAVQRKIAVQSPANALHLYTQILHSNVSPELISPTTNNSYNDIRRLLNGNS
jgi:hypothetical protein